MEYTDIFRALGFWMNPREWIFREKKETQSTQNTQNDYDSIDQMKKSFQSSKIKKFLAK